jgi:protein-S-isoprenylcysteine O-methyltransferase Ste14
VLSKVGSTNFVFDDFLRLLGCQKPLWDVGNTFSGTALTLLFRGGWLVVLTSTFMINDFDLFGFNQIYANLKKRQATQLGFIKVGLYQLVRHPIMTGFLIAFWAAPTMTVGHLLFALVTTGYIVIAVLHLEEKDLIAQIGDYYVAYQREISAFILRFGRGR